MARFRGLSSAYLKIKLDAPAMGRYPLTILNRNGNKAMFDFKSHYAIVKSVMQSKAKEEHKPSLDNKASMAAYAKTIGAAGVKASFIEDKNHAINWSV